MIQANELRVGNNVFDPFDNIVEIVEIRKDSLHLSNGNGGFFSSFSPIPLKPEILEHCGFYKINNKDDEFAFVFKKQGVLIELSEFYTKEGRAVFYYNLPDTINAKCIAYCKYLHELQNLIFAVTGTELVYQIQESDLTL